MSLQWTEDVCLRIQRQSHGYQLLWRLAIELKRECRDSCKALPAGAMTVAVAPSLPRPMFLAPSSARPRGKLL